MPQPPQKPSEDDNLDWVDDEEKDHASRDAWPEDVGPDLDEDWEVNTPETEDLCLFDESQEYSSDEDLDFSDVALEPTTVGHKEHASLPDHGIHLLLARFSTDSERSTLHAAVQQSTENRVTLHLDQIRIELPSRQEGEALVIPLRIAIGNQVIEGDLQLVATSGPAFVVLGRDLIAGQFIVDPASKWIQSKR